MDLKSSLPLQFDAVLVDFTPKIMGSSETQKSPQNCTIIKKNCIMAKITEIALFSRAIIEGNMVSVPIYPPACKVGGHDFITQGAFW